MLPATWRPPEEGRGKPPCRGWEQKCRAALPFLLQAGGSGAVLGCPPRWATRIPQVPRMLACDILTLPAGPVEGLENSPCPHAHSVGPARSLCQRRVRFSWGSLPSQDTPMWLLQDHASGHPAHGLQPERACTHVETVCTGPHQETPTPGFPKPASFVPWPREPLAWPLWVHPTRNQVQKS